MGSQITVHKVQCRQPGEAGVGCGPNDIQIFYKEDCLRSDGVAANRMYLMKLLTAQGFDVREGEDVPNTPLRYLCISKPGRTAAREEVLQALEDPEIDLSNVDRPAGNRGMDT